jgi:hypothetical protein
MIDPTPVVQAKLTFAAGRQKSWHPFPGDPYHAEERTVYFYTDQMKMTGKHTWSDLIAGVMTAFIRRNCMRLGNSIVNDGGDHLQIVWNIPLCTAFREARNYTLHNNIHYPAELTRRLVAMGCLP